jgi:hypothetical protein
MTVEEYVEGRGADAQRVKRTRIKLYNRNAALMDIGRLFGFILEKGPREPQGAERWAKMTPEERAQHAMELQQRAEDVLRVYRERFAAAAAPVTDAEYTEVQPPPAQQGGFGSPE